MNKVDTKVLSQQDGDRSIKRIKQLLAEECGYAEIVETLRMEGYKTLRLKDWTIVSLKQTIWKLRHHVKTFYGLSARRAGLLIKPLLSPEGVAA